MSISSLIQKWSGINETSKILIIADNQQKNIADSIKDEKIYNVQIEKFTKNNEFFDMLKSLKSSDLVIVLLSIDTYMNSVCDILVWQIPIYSAHTVYNVNISVNSSFAFHLNKLGPLIYNVISI